MPQMMPINWLVIFMMCLMCSFTIMILMNSFLLYIIMKNIYNMNNNNNNKNNLIKKWKWLW